MSSRIGYDINLHDADRIRFLPSSLHDSRMQLHHHVNWSHKTYGLHFLFCDGRCEVSQEDGAGLVKCARSRLCFPLLLLTLVFFCKSFQSVLFTFGMLLFPVRFGAQTKANILEGTAVKQMLCQEESVVLRRGDKHLLTVFIVCNRRCRFHTFQTVVALRTTLVIVVRIAPLLLLLFLRFLQINSEVNKHNLQCMKTIYKIHN